MNKLTIDDLSLSNKRVLVRVDFNVPLTPDGTVADDLRIRAALPTIKKIISSGGFPVLMSHLGRPKGERKSEFSLQPVAQCLTGLLSSPVKFASDCVGTEVEEQSRLLEPGETLLLENLRFHIEETKNDPGFAEKLSKLGDVYVNDAFGTAHRAHASTEGVTKFFDQCAAGYLMEKELQYLIGALSNPARPFVAILGGAKISGKIDVIKNLFDKVDSILIGGAMTFTFFKAMGYEVGDSLLEEDRVEMAGEVLAKAKAKNVELILPVDIVVSDAADGSGEIRTVPFDGIPAGLKGLDIGEASITRFEKILSGAKAVVWNGPMGLFEVDKFATGTYRIAKILADITGRGAVTIVGGGDSASAVAKSGLQDKITHISTGGGASLELLEGKTLPGLAALSDK
ncbi:MAG: phosphoglycerate kinase [Candidatus Zixiibacteriota bacterium]